MIIANDRQKEFVHRQNVRLVVGITLIIAGSIGFVLAAHAQSNAVTVLGADPKTVEAALNSYLTPNDIGWIARAITGLAKQFPKLTALFALIGVLRPFLHSVNAWLTNYCKSNLSRQQFANLVHLSGSPAFKRIEFVVHMLLSIQPSVLLGALQISAVGDSPEALHASGYLREPALDRSDDAPPLIPSAADSHPPSSITPPHNP